MSARVPNRCSVDQTCDNRLGHANLLGCAGGNGRYPDAAVMPTETPERESLAEILLPFLEENIAVFRCPGDNKYFDREGLSYEYNASRFAKKKPQGGSLMA